MSEPSAVVTVNIKAGDVVRLNSGGPSMDVELVDGLHVNVVWFDIIGNENGDDTRWSGPHRFRLFLQNLHVVVDEDE